MQARVADRGDLDVLVALLVDGVEPEEREEEVEQLKREAVALKREREEVRTRVENMLRQIEALAEEAAAD